MLLNETKGSLGMFSSVGKNSVEKYHILMRKDEIINGKLQKKVFNNVFGQDEDNVSNITDEEDEKDLLESNKTNGKNLKLIKIELRKSNTRQEKKESCTFGREILKKGMIIFKYR